MGEGPKILTIDIETSPNLAHVWSLWNVNVSLAQLQESGEVISFAAKWYGKRPVEFRSVHHDGHDAMVERAHALLDEADILIHYNGRSFDVPYLKREFLLAGKPPPSPFKEVDLLRVVKANFRFPSNKLDYVSRALGLGGKVSHTGHQLWVDCMAGDPKAWARMKTYNVGDVRLTESLYDALLPWISNHPAMGLYTGTDGCNRCGSTDLERRGKAYSPLGIYQQYRCNGCGGWLRGGKRLDGVDIRGIK